MIRLNYFCVVEGQQEKMYLDRLSELLNDFPQRTVTFNSVINNAEQLRRKNYAKYDSVCLFDFDCKKMEFERSIKTCVELDNKRSKGTRQNPGTRVHHAYSSMCFDLWLVLHKECICHPASSPKDYISDVIKYYNFPENSDIKQERVIKRIVDQIELKDVKKAISYAQQIRKSKLPEDKQFITGLDNVFYYPNPDFSLDLFIQEVLEKSGINM